jgi:CBS domain containing-hemolysin-like protein
MVSESLHLRLCNDALARLIKLFVAPLSIKQLSYLLRMQVLISINFLIALILFTAALAIIAKLASELAISFLMVFALKAQPAQLLIERLIQPVWLTNDVAVLCYC